MGVQYPLAVVLGLIDKLSGPFGKSMRSMGSAGKTITTIGKSLRNNVTLPLLGLGAASIIASTSFGAEMNRTQAASGATGEAMHAARSEIVGLARDTKTTPKQAAEALHALVEEGEALPEALENTRQALLLMNVAQMEVASSAGLLDDLLDAYGNQAGGAGAAADILTRASRAGGDEIASFGAALVTIGPLARQLGVPLLSVSKQLAVLTDRGMSSEAAAAGLRAAYVGLTRAGATAGDGTLNMADVLDKMAENGVKADDLVKKFGRSAGPVLATLLDGGTAALDRMGEKLDQVKSLHEQNEIVNQGEVGAAKDLASAWSTLLIKAGEGGLISALTGITERLIPLLDLFNNASPSTQRWGVILGVVAAAVGPLTILIGGLVAALSTTVGLIVAGAAAAGAAGWWLYENWQSVSEGLGSVFQSIGSGFSWLWDWILKGVHWLEDLLPDWLRDRLFGSGEGIGAASFGPPEAPPLATGDPIRDQAAAGLAATQSEAKVEISLRNFPPGTRVQTSGDADVSTDLGLAMIGAGG